MSNEMAEASGGIVRGFSKLDMGMTDSFTGELFSHMQGCFLEMFDDYEVSESGCLTGKRRNKTWILGQYTYQ